MVENLKQVIIVRNDIGMGKGKLAAQVAHASVSAIDKIVIDWPEWVEQWKSEGMEKIVLKVNSEKELLILFEKIKTMFPAALIKDAGHTQIKSGTITCFGVGPVPEHLIDEFTKKLKLV